MINRSGGGAARKDSLGHWVRGASTILLGLLLSGCVIDNAVREGAEANDAAVGAAEFTLCQGASIGSIRRAFGDRPDVWLSLCGDSFLLEE